MTPLIGFGAYVLKMQLQLYLYVCRLYRWCGTMSHLSDEEGGSQYGPTLLHATLILSWVELLT